MRVEFNARIDASGKIALPASIAGAWGKNRGVVHVCLTTDSINRSLRRRGVTDEEIERIASVQLEPREQAIRFLLSEGVLRHSRMAGRLR